MKNLALYPLKFDPIFKPKVWGGDKLNRLFYKNCDNGVGESWEISGVENNISSIANGEFKGESLNWLIENFQESLVGSDVYQRYGNIFPLLFKFIDATENLSVQVHPDDELAQEKHHSFGKTEMWYVLESDPQAQLIIGFQKETNKTQYLQALADDRVVELLKCEPVERGDAFIINPGTIHAIGAGVLLAEIQQTSDITYRIYDWNRRDSDGRMRELHTDLALKTINFSASKSRLNYDQQMNLPVHIGGTKFFEVNKISLSRDFSRSLDFANSFKVYMCISGKATMESNGFSVDVKNGETILIPAELQDLKIKTSHASFLEVFIP